MFNTAGSEDHVFVACSQIDDNLEQMNTLKRDRWVMEGEIRKLKGLQARTQAMANLDCTHEPAESQEPATAVQDTPSKPDTPVVKEDASSSKPKVENAEEEETRDDDGNHGDKDEDEEEEDKDDDSGNESDGSDGIPAEDPEEDVSIRGVNFSHFSKESTISTFCCQNV